MRERESFRESEKRASRGAAARSSCSSFFLSPSFAFHSLFLPLSLFFFSLTPSRNHPTAKPFSLSPSLPPLPTTTSQVDVDRIRRDNEARTDAQRKGGLIIWSGPNPTKAMKDRWQVEARARYGLSAEQLAAVEAEFAERVEALAEGGKGGRGGDAGTGAGGAGGAGAPGAASDGGAAAAALEAGVSSLLAASEAATVKPLSRDS